MIGRLHSVVLDCPDAEKLAEFYVELTGLEWADSDGYWVTLKGPDGHPRLCLQSVADYQPPQWPDPTFPQQAHLDVEVDDIQEAEQAVLRLGATLLRGGGSRNHGFRVYADPVGHPFCLVWGQD
ncbi:VOC family protein [Micromonospora echinofusca]|uniref:VOC family protein n=1 Tax=Micromonospora echinofusca TaxID=47858 RepID=UPI000C70F6F0|nr:VOC family protein [Micromonospora sp. MSM11]MCL7457414.1 VOC family protein [Micromonospora sp. MSM11]